MSSPACGRFAQRPITGALRCRARPVMVAFVLGLVVVGCGQTASVAERMDQAAGNLEAGNFHAAEVRLKQVLREDGTNARAWLLLGQASFARGRYEDAAHQFERARDAGALSSDYTLALAQSYMGSGAYEKVIAALDGFRPDEIARQVRVRVMRGDAQAQLGRRDEAADSYARALDLDDQAASALTGEAELAAAAGDAARARSLFEAAVAAQPDYAPAIAALAKVDYQANRCDAAIEGFDRALSVSGESSLGAVPRFQLNTFLADCRLRNGDDAAAEKIVQSLLEAAPRNPYPNYLQALIDLRAGRYEQASSYLQRVLNANPDHIRSLMLMAAVKTAQNDPSTAQTYLTRVLARTPDNADALRMRAQLYLRQDKRHEALETLREAYRDNADAAGVRPLLAQLLAQLDKREAGEGDEASDAALQLDIATALARQGNATAARVVLGRVEPATDAERSRLALARVGIELAAGDNAAAVREGERFSERLPDDARVQRALARAYAAAGRDDDATRSLEKAAQLAPEDEAIVHDQVRLAVQRGRYDEAERRLNALHNAQPDDSQIVLDLANVYARQNKTAAQVDLLENASERDPSDVRLGSALINAYLVASRPDQAVALADRLSKVHPDNADLKRMSGIAQLVSGKIDAGLDALQAAAAQASEQPEYRFDLAQAQLRAGRPEAAITTLSTLREKSPDFLPAVGMLAMVQARAGDMKAALGEVATLRRQGDAVQADRLEGDIRLAAGDTAEAAQAYEDAYSAEPTAAVAMALFEARRRAGLGAPARSLEDWLRRSPDDTRVALTLAQWEQGRGRLDDAAARYRAIIDVQPESVVALNNLAVIYQSRDDSRARAMAERAYAVAPRNPAVADTLGWVAVQSGDLQQGLTLLQQSVADAGDAASPTVQYHLAYALSRTEDPARLERARDLLDSALSSKASFDERDDAAKLAHRLAEDTPTPADNTNEG